MKRITPSDRHLGARIKYYRKEKGWTQEQLAARMQVEDCNISKSILARIEGGHRSTSVYEIDQFVKVFGISYDELFAE